MQWRQSGRRCYLDGCELITRRSPAESLRTCAARTDLARAAWYESTGVHTPPCRRPAASSGRLPAIALAALAVYAAAAIVMTWRSETVAPPIIDAVGTTGAIAAASPEMPPVAARSMEPARAAAGMPATAPARDEIVAVIEAERAAWIAASADGQRVLYRIMPPGTTETLRARREITIRVGDAGAVRLSVNGGPAAPVGQDGQVRNVRLTPAAFR